MNLFLTFEREKNCAPLISIFESLFISRDRRLNLIPSFLQCRDRATFLTRFSGQPVVIIEYTLVVRERLGQARVYTRGGRGKGEKKGKERGEEKKR